MMPLLHNNARQPPLYPTTLENNPCSDPSPMTTCAPGAHTFFIVPVNSACAA